MLRPDDPYLSENMCINVLMCDMLHCAMLTSPMYVLNVGLCVVV